MPSAVRDPVTRPSGPRPGADRRSRSRRSFRARRGRGTASSSRRGSSTASTNAVTATVVAPVPWFPSAARLFGDYGAYRPTPRLERRGGVEVRHPRYLMIPKVGMRIQPWTLAHAAEREIRRLARDGFDFDLIDAHYFYPDGVAAAILARRWASRSRHRPRQRHQSHRSARGPAPADPRRRARGGSRRRRLQALGQAMQQLGVAPDRIVVLRNGVDLELFRPVDRGEARRALGLGDGKVLVSVGNLVPLKRHDLFIEAVAGSPGIEALIVGSDRSGAACSSSSPGRAWRIACASSTRCRRRGCD